MGKICRGTKKISGGGGPQKYWGGGSGVSIKMQLTHNLAGKREGYGPRKGYENKKGFQIRGGGSSQKYVGWGGLKEKNCGSGVDKIFHCPASSGSQME